MLKPGQVFMLGWRLSGLSMSEAVLARGKERRTIDLFDPNAAGRPASPQPAQPTPAARDASAAPMAHNGRAGFGGLSREA
jgi:hypothetical protein